MLVEGATGHWYPKYTTHLVNQERQIEKKLRKISNGGS